MWLNGKHLQIWANLFLFVLALSAGTASIGNEKVLSNVLDLDTYGNEVAKKRLLSQTAILWRVIDLYEEFRGKYVETYGYLCLVDNVIVLFPSIEAATIPLMAYSTAIPRNYDPLSKYQPRAGDFVQILARVTDNERWQSVDGPPLLFDEIVSIDRYFFPSDYGQSIQRDCEWPR